MESDDSASLAVCRKSEPNVIEELRDFRVDTP